MKIETHIKSSLEKYGIEGRDIHEWIDGHFNHDSFQTFISTGVLPKNWDPYEHRVHRHCIEALDECIDEFKDLYSTTEIESVFKSHLSDDYHGHIPERKEFDNVKFYKKHHKF